MKKRLIIPCVLFSTMLAAQVNDNPQTITGQDDGFWSLTVIPKEFSYNNDNRMCLKLADDKVAIYNNEFQCTKLLTIPAKYGEIKYVSEERKSLGRVAKITYSAEYPIALPEGFVKGQVIEYLSSEYGFNVSSMNTENGVTFYLSDNQEYYYQYSTYGTQYPTYYFVFKDDGLYSRNQSYEEKDTYSDEWTVVDMVEYESDFYGTLITDYNASNSNYDNTVLLTQTLFNEDESYEYLNFIYSLNSEAREEYCQETTIIYDSNEGQYVNDCIRRQKVYGSTCTGFEIKQDNGNVIQSIRFPNGFSMNGYKKDVLASIVHIGEYYYLIMTGTIDEESAMLVYRINRSNGSGVEQVSEPVKIGAYPNPANRNQTITIQLIGEKAGTAPTELRITNLQGQVVGRCIMLAGEKKTTISSEKLVPGMNVINVLQGGKSVGKEKVIVK